MLQLSIPAVESFKSINTKNSIIRFHMNGTVETLSSKGNKVFDADTILTVASFAFGNFYDANVESINFENLTSGELKSLAIIVETM